MVKWVPAKGRWCCAAGKVTAGQAESNGSLLLCEWLKSPAGWLYVHRDQLLAQRSVMSMESLYLLPFIADLCTCNSIVLAVMAGRPWSSTKNRILEVRSLSFQSTLQEMVSVSTTDLFKYSLRIITNSSSNSRVNGRRCSLFLHVHEVITGPSTHSVGGPVLFCSLASVFVICRRL